MGKSNTEIWDEIAAYAQDAGIKTRYKGKSWFMKLLGLILFFNPKFMTKYITDEMLSTNISCELICGCIDITKI